MYLGAVALFLGAPLLIGSLVGIAIGIATCLLLVGRIIGEESMRDPPRRVGLTRLS